MAGGSILDKFIKLPKWVQYGSGGLLVLVVGFGLFYMMFGTKKPVVDQNPETILLDMPDAADNRYADETRMQAYRTGDMVGRFGNDAVEDYWNSLGGDLVSKDSDAIFDENDLAGGNYTDLEKYYIRNGIKTKAQIDAEHTNSNASFDEIMAKYNPNVAVQKPMTQEQKDSAYFARMERAYEMALRYSTPAAAAVEETMTGGNTPEEELERKLDLDQPASIPVESFSMSDGIISSLDAPADDGLVHYSGGVARRPVKATFLKTEKLSDGQRVIIRLMQDLYLADGTMIPANTHITGICKFGRRLMISVTMLHYGGRMFPADISVYDNDGTEGIYCPTVESKKKVAKVAEDVGKSVIGAAGSMVGSLLTGNPFIGTVASRGINSITSSINSDGTVSVDVSAGYEFYVFENEK